MKIRALCNSKVGIPTLDALYRAGVLDAIGTTDQDHEGPEQAMALANSIQVPCKRFSKAQFSQAIREWVIGCDALVVVTFPYKIPADALDLPTMGCWNFHFAPLPQYRGAEPVFWVLRNREPEGAVAVFRMTAGWDEGPLLFQHSFPILSGDPYGLYMGRAAMESAGQIPRFLQAISQGKALEPQDAEKAKYWERPGYEDVLIDWQKMSGIEIHALVAATNPWNKGAYTSVGNMPIRILETALVGQAPEGVYPGQIVAADLQQGLFVATVDGQVLEIRVVFTDLGYITGARLVAMGIGMNMDFR